MRHDGRQHDQLRPVTIQRGFTASAAGSVLIKAGRTTVLCTASVSEGVPPWMTGQGRGWLTAEYNMLPGSTSPRHNRERSKVGGRTSEIQRLIGRSLRAVLDFSALGERTVTIDCDVLEADGGTRTASITGAFVALVDALRTLPLDRPALRQSVAAVSVGVVAGVPVADLDYQEDSTAEVDSNIVMTGAGDYIEVQGTGEGTTFTHEQLLSLLALGAHGISQLTERQRQVLGSDWPEFASGS